MKNIVKYWRGFVSVLMVGILVVIGIPFSNEAKIEASEDGRTVSNPGNLQWKFDEFTPEKVYEDRACSVLNDRMIRISGFANASWVREYLNQRNFDTAQFTIGTKLSESKEGKNGASITYCNIGLVEENGVQQKIDMKITLTGWKVMQGASEEKAFVLFSTCIPDAKGNDNFPYDQCAIGIWLSDNVRYINLKYTFYKAGTEEEISVNGSFTQVDLDYKQYFAYENETSNIRTVHKSEDDLKVWADGLTSHISIVEGEPLAGWTTVNSSAHGLDPNQQETYRAGYVSAEFASSQLNFQFGTKAALNKNDELKQYYFGILPYSIASYKEPVPVKYVSGDGTMGSYGDCVYKRNGDKEIHYISNVYIPRSLSANYDSFGFTDTLNEVLDATNARISVWKNNPIQLEDSFDGGTVIDVTNWFDIKKTGQKIVVNAKESTIAESNQIDFFGNSYQLEIITNIKDDIDLEAYVSHESSDATIVKEEDYYVISNTVSCTTGVFNPQINDGVGGYERKLTHSAPVFVYYAEPMLTIHKSANDVYYNVGDMIHYEIEVKQSKKQAVANHVFISDQSLPSAIKIVENSAKAHVLRDGVKEELTVTVKDNGVTTGKADIAYEDKLLLEFDAIAEQATSEVGATNIARAFGDHVQAVEASETVHVAEPKMKAAKKVISNPSNGLAYEIGDIVKYQVQISNPVDETYVENLKISDSWQDGMSLKAGSVKVYYCFGEDDESNPSSEDLLPIEEYDLLEKDSGYEIALKNEMALFWGVGYVVVEYETEIAAIPNENKIANVVIASASNVGKVSDRAVITVGSAPAMEVKKEVDASNACVGEKITYTIMAENTGYYAISDFELKDASLPKGFVLESLQVFFGEKYHGKFVWELIQSGDSGIYYEKMGEKDWSVTIPSYLGGALSSNKGIQVKAVYVIDKRAEVNKEIVNTITAVGIAANGQKLSGKDTATVYVRKPELTIIKSANKDIYGVGEKGIYTVTVSQPMQVEDQSMVAYDILIKDLLDATKGVQFGKILSITKVDAKGKENRLSEEEYTLSKEGESLEIRTNESLAYGERLVFQYEVLFEDPAAEQIVNNASAQGTNTEIAKTSHSVNISRPQLKITKTSDRQYYNFSDVAKYNIVITQTEKAVARDIVLVDTFHLDVSFVEYYLADVCVYDSNNQLLDNGEYSYSLEGSGYRIEFKEPLEYNESYTVTYSFEMYASYEEYGDVVNTATVTASNAESVTAECRVACYMCQLGIDKSVNKETWYVGDKVQYVVEVKNLQAKTDAMGVEVIDTSIPESMPLDKNNIQAEVFDSEGHFVDAEDIVIDFEESDNGWIVKKELLGYGYTFRITFQVDATEAVAGRTILNRAYAYADNSKDEVFDLASVKVLERQDYETTINVTKKIKSSDVYFPHGNPMFVIVLEGKDIFGNKHKYNKLIEFTKDYVSGHTDMEGYVSMSVAFCNLPMGEYKIYEKNPMRYRLESIEGVFNGEIQGEAVIVNSSKIKQDMVAQATFQNEKYEWQQCSHTAVATNEFH